MTDRNHADLRQGIVETCQEMNRSGLNQGTSGNLSHRIPNGMLITPTSLPYDRKRSEDIVANGFYRELRGRDRQHVADRLDPMRPTMIVDEADHGLDRRSSSAIAK
jgi:hypothetical protein